MKILRSENLFILGCVILATIAGAKSGIGIIFLQDAPSAATFPVFRGCSTFNGKGGAYTLQLPAGTVNGDLLVAMCETANEVAVIATDWVEVPCSPSTHGITCPGDADCTRITMWTNAWTAGENLTVDDAGDHLICGVCGFEVGTFDTSDHIDGCTINDEGNRTAISISGATTTVDFVRVLSVSVGDGPDTNNQTQFSGEVNTSLTDLAEIADQCKNTGNGGCIFVADGKNETFDAMNATTVTAATSAARANIMLGIKPAP